MFKRIYSKTEKIEEDVKHIILKNKDYTLKELLSIYAIPGTKLKWEGQKRTFKVIARNDNFIIITRPYNPKKTYEYSILDLEYMKCNHDNYYCKYNYQDSKECEEAIRELQEGRNEENKAGFENDCYLQLSKRGIADIEDIITEIWIEVKVK